MVVELYAEKHEINFRNISDDIGYTKHPLGCLTFLFKYLNFG